MFNHPLMFIWLPLLLLSGCQPQQPSSSEQELKQSMAEIKLQLVKMEKQIKEIHEIATASTAPKAKELPPLADLDNQGKLPSLGQSDAPIVIVEFSDFQCPYCKRFLELSFPKLKQQYIDTGKVKYLVRNFPLSFHANAESAAIAAACADKQDSYWPMREQLFANITRLNPELYINSAKQQDLQLPDFEACLDDPAVKAGVMADLQYGQQYGVTGTPSFIIGRVSNNRMQTPKLLVGAHPYEAFSAILDKLQQDN